MRVRPVAVIAAAAAVAGCALGAASGPAWRQYVKFRARRQLAHITDLPQEDADETPQDIRDIRSVTIELIAAHVVALSEDDENFAFQLHGEGLRSIVSDDGVTSERQEAIHELHLDADSLDDEARWQLREWFDAGDTLSGRLELSPFKGQLGMRSMELRDEEGLVLRAGGGDARVDDRLDPDM